MMTFITWGIIIIGAVLIVLSATLFRRKGEAEISESLTSIPAFKIGVIFVIVGFVGKIIEIFI